MLEDVRVLLLALALFLAACDVTGGVLVRSRLAPAGDASSTQGMDASPAQADAQARDASLAHDAAPSGPRDAGGADAARVDAASEPGSLLGQGEAGYYYAALESDYTGADVSVLDTSCTSIAALPSDFVDDICIEGVGKLGDGRVLQFAALCACGYACPTQAHACFGFVDESAAPWGFGNTGRALVPLRSLAVDPAGPLASAVLYLPALDGVSIPASQGIGSFVHDGCVRADDGGSFASPLDFRLFTGNRATYQALEASLASNTSTEVYVGGARCQGLAP